MKLLVPEGQQLVTLDEWASNTLSPEELSLFEAARTRHQNNLTAGAVSTNPVDDNSWEMVFADDNSKTAFPTNVDEEFVTFWNRYLQDTGYVVEESEETI